MSNEPRRYGLRPATENLERPKIVVTTRPTPTPKPTSKSSQSWTTEFVVATMFGGLGLLAIGVLIGIALRSNSDVGQVTTSLQNRPTSVDLRTGPVTSLGSAFAEIDTESVSFLDGSADLSPTGQLALDQVTQLLNAQKSLRVEIAVHTYSERSSQENHDLSRRQATTIFQYLTDSGVEPIQLQLAWHGDPPHFAAPGRLGAVTFTVVQ